MENKTLFASAAPTAVIAPFGQRTELTLNDDGYLVAATPDPSEAPYTMSYHDAGGLLGTFTTPRETTSTFSYDELGRLTQDLAADGAQWALSRAAGPNQQTVIETDAAGGTRTITQTGHYNDTRTQTVTFTDGTQNRVEIANDQEQVATWADGTVVTTRRLENDQWGLMAPVETVITKLPSGLTQSLSRKKLVTLSDVLDPTSATRVEEITTQNDKLSRSVFLLATRTRTLTSPLGRIARVVYDTQGRPMHITAPGREQVVLVYDGAGRLQSTTQGSGAAARTTTQSYFASSGYLQSVTDEALLQTTSYTRDAMGRALSVSRPDGQSTDLGYDAIGNLTALTPPSRPAHGLDYTPANLLSAYVAPAAVSGGEPATLQYAYRTDRKLDIVTLPGGLTIDYDYRSDGKLQTLTTLRGATAFAYHATTGKLLTVATPDGGVLAYAYDGPLLAGTNWGGGGSHVQGSVTQSYDADFRTDVLRVNGAAIADYAYDADGLLTSTGALAVTRDAQSGDITATALGALATSELISTFGEQDGYIASYSGADLYSEQVTERDGRGRMVERVETVQSVSHTYRYQYDGAGRLADVRIDGAQAAHYDYDANGNRQACTTTSGTDLGVYDAQDRLTSYASATYSYTPAGELATKSDAIGTTLYDYDVFGNLRGVQLTDGRLIEYEIDGQNRRIGKKVDGMRQYGLLYQDQLEPVAMLDASNNVVATFVYATRGHVPDYMVKGGVTYRLVVDHVGSVRMVVNVADGSVAQRVDYSAFGEVLSDTAPGFQPFGFAGGIYDADTGLVRFGARDYDAVTGRWTAKDPILFGGGQENLYVYVDNDPVNFIDPTGLGDIPWCGPGGQGIYGQDCMYMTCVHGDGTVTDPSTYPEYRAQSLCDDASTLASDWLAAGEYVIESMWGQPDVDPWISDQITTPASEWGDALQRNREARDCAAPTVQRPMGGAAPPPRMIR